MKRNARGMEKERGFVALISTLIISAILLGLVFTAGAASFYARFDSLGIENKRVSLGLAESCIEIALLALSTSTAPSALSPTNQIVPVGIDPQWNPTTCVIESVTHAGGVATIKAHASFRGTFSAVVVSATVADPTVAPASFPAPPNIDIQSWTEKP